MPGFEGAGVIVDLGANVKDLTHGALVLLPHNIGTWREAVAVKANELVTVPDGIEPVHAAMLKINPMTAWHMLHGTSDELRLGDLLACEGGELRIVKYIGFEEARWVIPEQKPAPEKPDGP